MLLSSSWRSSVVPGASSFFLGGGGVGGVGIDHGWLSGGDGGGVVGGGVGEVH